MANFGGGHLLGTLNFSEFERDYVVIHFGGDTKSVDAYTFANALIAFADTVRAINSVVNPGQDIEIRLEAQAPGSYRAVVRRIRKGLGGFLSTGVASVFWGIVATVIYENTIRTPDRMQVTVKDDEVIIEHGSDRVIVPRDVYETLPNVRKNPDVQRHLKRTFQIVERDEAITNFGLTAKIDDPTPTLIVPRDEFARLAEGTDIILTEDQRVRRHEESARLVILKAWINHADRKWSFEWNGVPLSAPIKDDEFLDKLDQREYLIGAGDALDVTLSYKQYFDEEISVFRNDTNSFVIIKVNALIARTPQQRLMVPPLGNE